MLRPLLLVLLALLSSACREDPSPHILTHAEYEALAIKLHDAKEYKRAASTYAQAATLCLNGCGAKSLLHAGHYMRWALWSESLAKDPDESDKARYYLLDLDIDFKTGRCFSSSPSQLREAQRILGPSFVNSEQNVRYLMRAVDCQLKDFINCDEMKGAFADTFYNERLEASEIYRQAQTILLSLESPNYDLKKLLKARISLIWRLTSATNNCQTFLKIIAMEKLPATFLDRFRRPWFGFFRD